MTRHDTAMEPPSQTPPDVTKTTTTDRHDTAMVPPSQTPPSVNKTTIVHTTTDRHDTAMAPPSRTPADVTKTTIVHTTMPSSRRRLRPFLIDKLNSGQFKGLSWVDKAQGKFRIPWKHGAKQGWSPDDSRFFKEWARHTGRYVEGVDSPQWSAWKTRIRCAFNKSPDIVEVKAESNVDDRDDPYKVYEFKGPIEDPQARPNASQHKPGTSAWLCKRCSTGFPDVESHNSHKCKALDSVPPLGAKQYVCDKCGYNTESYILLHHHLQSHVGEKNNNTVSAAAATGRVAAHRSGDSAKPYVCKLCNYQTDREVEYEQHQHSHLMETDVAPGPCVLKPTAIHDGARSEKAVPCVIVLPKPPAEHTGDRTPPIDLSVMSRLSLTKRVNTHGKTAPINLSSSPDRGPTVNKASPILLPVNSKYIFAKDGQSQDKKRAINLRVDPRRAAVNDDYIHNKTPPINLRLCAQCDYCTLCGDDLERHLQEAHNKAVSPKVKPQTKVKEVSEDKLPTHDSQRESKKQKLQDKTKAMPTDTNHIPSQKHQTDTLSVPSQKHQTDTLSVPSQKHQTDTQSAPSQKYVVEINLPAANGSEVKAVSEKKRISLDDLVEWSSIIEGSNSASKKVLVLQPTVNKPNVSHPTINKPNTSHPTINKPNASHPMINKPNASHPTINKPHPANITDPSNSRSSVDPSAPNPNPSASKTHVDASLANSPPSATKSYVDPSPPDPKVSMTTDDVNFCLTKTTTGKDDTAPRPASFGSPLAPRAVAGSGLGIHRNEGEITTVHAGGLYCVTSKQHSDPDTGSVYCVTTKKPLSHRAVNGSSGNETVSRPTHHDNAVTSNKPVSPSTVSVKSVTSKSTGNSPVVRVGPIISNSVISDSIQRPSTDPVSTITTRALNDPPTVTIKPLNVSTVVSRRQNKASNVNHNPFFSRREMTGNETMGCTPHEEAKSSFDLESEDNSEMPVLRNRLSNHVSVNPTPATSSSRDPDNTDVPLDLSSKSKVQQELPPQPSTQPGNLSTTGSSPGKTTRKERVRHDPNVNKHIQRLRPWLTDKLNVGNIKGLYWLNKHKSIFRIPWKHGGKHDWSPEHSQIFKEWAKHTGKFREGADEWAKWKTRIRCAFNKSPEIVEIKELADVGAETLDPYKVYMFIDADQDSPVWPCEVCFETFPSAAAREAHRLSHNAVVDIKPYVCPQCEFCTDNQDLLYQHQLTHNVIGTLQLVPVVLGVYTDGHQVPAPAKESFLCDLCTYCTENQAELVLHQQTHAIGTIQTVTIKQEDTAGDGQEMTVVSSFTCDRCDYCTESREKYEQHQQAHLVSTMDAFTVKDDTEVTDHHQQSTISIMNTFTVREDTEFTDQHQQAQNISTMSALTVRQDTEFTDNHQQSNMSTMTAVTVRDNMEVTDHHQQSNMSTMTAVTVRDNMKVTDHHQQSNMNTMTAVTVRDNKKVTDHHQQSNMSMMTAVTVRDNTEVTDHHQQSNMSTMNALTVKDNTEVTDHHQQSNMSTIGTFTVREDAEFTDQHQQAQNISTMSAFTVGQDTEFEECSDDETAVITSYVCIPDTDDIETEDVYHHDQWTLVKENDTNSPEAAPTVSDQTQAAGETSDVAVYICDQCGTLVDTQELFEVHQQSHDTSTMVHQQSHDTSTMVHQQSHDTSTMETLGHDSANNGDMLNDVRPYGCGNCDYCTLNKEDYELHLQMHRLKAMCVQTVVKDSSSTQIVSDHPETEAPDVKPQICEHCDYCTFNKEHYELHLHSHVVDTPQIVPADDNTEMPDPASWYICEVCGEAYKNRQWLDAHLQMHIEEEAPACTQCGKQFRTMSTLHNHLKTHTTRQDGSPLACVVCAKEEKDALALRKHMRAHWTKMMHTCTFCKELFADFKTFKIHVKDHGKNTPQIVPADDNTEMLDPVSWYICEVCGEAYKNRQWLDAHLQMHIEEEAPACTQCGKQFRTMSTLHNHLKTHTTRQDGAPLACVVCAKEEKEALVLRKHMRAHWTKMTHTCTFCNAVFSDFKTFKSHVKRHDKNTPQIVPADDNNKTPDPAMCYICEVCGKAYKKRQRLDAHLQMHIAEEAPACTQCGKQFRTMSTLNNHLKTHTTGQDGAPLACVVCGKEEKDAYLLKKHMREHWTKMTHTCALCKAVFPHFTTFKIHIKAHNEESRQTYGCKDCGKGFTELSQLKEHTKSCSTGSQTAPYQCKYCEEHFNDVNRLYQHSKTHTAVPKPANNHTKFLKGKAAGKEESGHFVWKRAGSTLTLTKQKVMHIERRVLVCASCAAGHGQRSALRNHTLTIRDIMYHVCSECGRRFRRDSDRQVYILPYTGSMDYWCSDCGKGFSLESSLTAHKLIHTGSRHHVCAHCGKAFSQEPTLRMHMRTHANIMQHVCADCGKAFSEEAGLRMHALTHTARMEHVCAECGNAYSKASSLKAHILTHPAMLDYVCAHCGEAFNQESGLNVHILTHSTDTRDCARSKIEYYNCRLCVRGFIHPEDLVDHMDHHTSDDATYQ